MGELIENIVTEQRLYEHEQPTAILCRSRNAHLLSAVKLQLSVSAAAFAEAIRQLSASLEQQQLLTTTGPIGKRFPHSIMDTDEADLGTFFIMSFENRAQLEEAVAHMTGSEDLSADTHRQLWDQLDSYRFTCWEDCAPQTVQATTGLVDPHLARGEFSDLTHPDPLDRLSATR